MKHLFVYGTLMTPYWNNVYLEGAACLHNKYIVSKHKLKVHSFILKNNNVIYIPHLYYTGDLSDRVRGEVWAVEDEDMPAIEALEEGYVFSEIPPQGGLPSDAELYTFLGNPAIESELSTFPEHIRMSSGEYAYKDLQPIPI